MTFEKHFNSYEENAIVQKKVAQNLAQFFTEIPHSPKTILEIGCGTGIFSREILKYFPNTNLSLNDIFDTSSFFTDRKSTRLNSSHANISYAVFCLKKKKSLYLSYSFFFFTT